MGFSKKFCPKIFFSKNFSEHGDPFGDVFGSAGTSHRVPTACMGSDSRTSVLHIFGDGHGSPGREYTIYSKNRCVADAHAHAHTHQGSRPSRAPLGRAVGVAGGLWISSIQHCRGRGGLQHCRGRGGGAIITKYTRRREAALLYSCLA